MVEEAVEEFGWLFANTPAAGARRRLLLNYHMTGVIGWRPHGRARGSGRVDRTRPMADGSPALWEFARQGEGPVSVGRKRSRLQPSAQA